MRRHCRGLSLVYDLKNMLTHLNVQKHPLTRKGMWDINTSLIESTNFRGGSIAAADRVIYFRGRSLPTVDRAPLERKGDLESTIFNIRGSGSLQFSHQQFRRVTTVALFKISLLPPPMLRGLRPSFLSMSMDTVLRPLSMACCEAECLL